MKRLKLLSGTRLGLGSLTLVAAMLTYCLQGEAFARVVACSPLAVGDVDPQFRPEVDGVIRRMVVQTNGQVLVSGDFGQINGLTRKNLARLNPNGSVDTAFAPVINGAIDTIAVQPDNRIVITGAFNEINGLPKAFMARLNPDGSLDPTLDAGVNWNSPGWGRPAIGQMVVQPDGKLLVAGNFTSLNGIQKPGLARLNADGSLDGGFTVTGISSGISTVALLPNGKMLVGGSFGFGGTANLGLARLNANGTIDPTFQAAIPNSYGAVYEIVPLPDGKFFTESPIISVGGISRQGIARMLPDGGLDLAFDPGQQITTDVFFELGPVSPDGKIIVYNYFYPPAIRRLNVDGSLDTSFVVPIQTGVSKVVGLNHGSLLVGGGFTVAGPISQPYLARVVTAGGPQQELVGFASTAQALDENVGQGELIVRRTGCTKSKVSVSYALLPGNATPGSDFNLAAGTLHWNANDTSDKIITFQILDDAIVEDAESFAVVLSNPIGASLSARTTSRVTILDNERRANQRDPSYQALPAITTGGFPSVYRMALGPDEKLLIQGAFTSVGGALRPGFARLKKDGSVDLQFNPQISGFVVSIEVQSDGKSIIGGGFTAVNGVNRTNLARLNADGSLDSSFNSIALPEMRAGVIAVQPDGRIIVATGDGAWNQSSGYILRLNADGSRDTTFQRVDLPDPASVRSVALQPDGTILLAGAFKLVGNDVVPGVMRLNANGTVDSSFNPEFNSLFYFITSLALQPDGKILVAGGLINLEAAPIVRLNPDGSLDPSFRAQYFHGDYVSIQGMRLQPDGKVVVGGWFTSIGETPRINVARLNADGSTDRSFDAGNLAGPDTFLLVYAVELQADGKVLLGGGLGSQYGQPSTGVIRLLPSNDTINTIEFASDSIAVKEDDGQVTVIVLREGNSASTVSVHLNLTGGTATPGEDFVSPGSIVTFGALEVSKAVVIPIINDHYLEPFETIRLGLSDPSSGLLNGHSSTTITIRDDEIPPSNLDTNFDLYPVFRALQPDDKILATFGSGLMRYMPDGTQDQTFQFVFASGVTKVVPQPDGKILIGGNFSTVGPSTNLAFRSGLTRLDTNGMVDAGFNPEVNAAGLSGIALQSDGRIVLAGVSSLVSTGFTRLLPNGQLDTTFRVHAFLGLSDPPEAAVAIQPDGKILIGGNFYLINGIQRSGIARLNNDGSLDTNFAPTVTGGFFTIAGVNIIQPLSDGKIWAGGVFTLVNGVAMSGITRLNADGTLDSSFNPAGGVDGSVTTLFSQSDGRIVIAGPFSKVAGTDRAFLARLNVDGSLDVGFAPALPNRASIMTLGRQSDGATLLGGNFCNYVPPPDCGGDNDDACDDDFSPEDYDCPGTLRLQPDPILKLLRPEILAGGTLAINVNVIPGRTYVLQSSTDLTHWTPLATNRPAAVLWNYSASMSPRPGTFYRVMETPR
ncbi:MAG: Ig family protein [Verrucomicrobiales bacterium]|nr:Ig family protein [Verrucomicrobiales bacterium]